MDGQHIGAGAGVDIYVETFRHSASPELAWVVRIGRGPYTAVHDDPADAVDHAIEMARYRAADGRAVQVHVRDRSRDVPWRTVWASPGAAPRYP